MSQYRQELMKIAEKIAQVSGGRARLAFQEEDSSTQKAEDAAHFIKVDEARVGRDIEMYGFFGDTVIGWEQTLAEFLQEILLPIKSAGLKNSYKEAGQLLKNLGHQIYSPELHKDWDALF